MFYGIGDDEAIGYAIRVADGMGMTDEQKRGIEQRMQILMRHDNIETTRNYVGMK